MSEYKEIPTKEAENTPNLNPTDVEQAPAADQPPAPAPIPATEPVEAEETRRERPAPVFEPRNQVAVRLKAGTPLEQRWNKARAIVAKQTGDPTPTDTEVLEIILSFAYRPKGFATAFDAYPAKKRNG